MPNGSYTEGAFEDAIEHHLLHKGGGYSQRLSSGYDADRALLLEDVLDFVTATQSKAWAKLRTVLGEKLNATFFDGLCKALDQRGSLAVFRKGLGFYGQEISLAYFKPSHGLNPAVQAKYDANRLSVVRQVHHDPKRPKDSIDLVLFLNGIPVVTAELKNHMTGQTAEHAKKQYMRRDAHAPLLQFRRRTLVHFAVGPDAAWMTTRLDGNGTRFLPFNKGHDDGAGNPPVEGKHRTHYLWEEVWQRDSLIDIVARFMLLESKAKTDSAPGKKQRSERLIFPRYHQLDCVRRLVRSAREEGPGTNYLVQHSAGSGKSNSIAWLAHRLAFLHDDQDKKVFNSVVVLTDRTVLDQQLQKRIADIEHVTGVVEKIEAGGVKSAKLAKALVSGVPIIVCTIHSFAFLHRQIASLPDRSYAVIVDEAHSSQSGEMSVKVKEALSEAEIAARLQQEIEDADDEATPDQVALRAAIARGKQDNLSFFAFTATPKYKTLHMFGHKGPDGRPAPFHLYSMKQAIEEQFILDVLRGYTTYDRFFELSKATPTDPDLDKRKAASALARFVNLHPTNVAAKTEVAVEHFRTVVKGRIGGKAKAMLVTGSRLQAVKYKLAFDKYIAEKGYSDIRCLVAFSGAVKDDDLPGSEPYTEVGMNQGIKERELPERFGSAEFQILLVADKYQTGFDQPLLHTMYVDKKLSGIQAVQTLSRLNRIHPDKTDTLVLDFFNKREHILASFKPFYTVTREDKDVDPQRLYELRDKLADAAIYLPDDIDGFADIFFKLKRDQAPTDHAGLNACLDCAVERYKVCDEEEQDAFRAALSAFRNLYGFLSQVVKFVDAELEKLYAFGRMLLRKLPRGEDDGPLDLSADVELMKLVVEKQEADDLLIDPADNPAVKGPSETGTGRGGGPVELLSEIIRLINERFGGDHDVEDLLRGVADQLAADEVVQQAARVNDKANFAVVFGPKLEDALVERHENHAVFIDKVYSDKEFRGALSALMLDAMYERLRAA